MIDRLTALALAVAGALMLQAWVRLLYALFHELRKGCPPDKPSGGGRN